MKNDNAVAYLNLGMLALHSGHDEQAVQFFRTVLEIRPDTVEACIGMGLAYSRMDKHSEMVVAFRIATQIDKNAVRKWAKASIPEPPMWLSTKPEYARVTGDMAELLRNQDEADALARLAAANIGMGMDVAAIEALERSLSLAPDYEAAIVLISFAYLLLESKQPETATQISQNSILKKNAPLLVKALFNKGGS